MPERLLIDHCSPTLAGMKTGNTEAMANAVAEGAKDKGADVSLIDAASFSSDQVSAYDGIAFGCPAMGDEVLEESE